MPTTPRHGGAIGPPAGQAASAHASYLSGEPRLTIIRRIPDAASITPQGVDRFLTSTAWAKATRANYHGAIRAWCKWLIITGRRADDPTLIATTPKVEKGRPPPVAAKHLTILLDTSMYRRTRAMILLAVYAGLRVSEIAAINGDDVNTVINTITVIGKGDKQRQIPLHPLLKDLAAVMPRRGWWFPTYIGNTKHLAGGPMLANSVSSSISNVMDRAGLPGTPHALRHWFGSALREAGVDSLVIKELTGHESLATTAIYVDDPLGSDRRRSRYYMSSRMYHRRSTPTTTRHSISSPCSTGPLGRSSDCIFEGPVQAHEGSPTLGR